MEAAFQDAAWHPGTYAPGRPYRHYRAGDLPGGEAYVRMALRLPVYSNDVRCDLDDYAAAIAKVSAAADELAAHVHQLS